MSKLFASDLDGTLLNILHTTDFIILHYIKKLIKKGHYFTIATGRNMRPSHIKHDFKDLDVYCIGMNGAIILHNNQIIYKRIINKKIVKDILDKFPLINFEFISENHVYVKCGSEVFEERAKKLPFFIRLIYKKSRNKFKDEYIYHASNEQILDEDIFKINCTINDKSLIQSFNEYLNANEDKIVNAPFNDSTYEITMHNVNKGEAIKLLAKRLNINGDDIYVYGDGKNDITMLKMFKNSYAPNNASKDAIEASNNIIGNNNLYSVVRHIYKVIKDNK